MHETRFFIRAGYPLAEAQGIVRASARFADVDRYIVCNAHRSGGDGVPALVDQRDRRPCPLGARSHVAPRERAALYARPACVWHHTSGFAGPRQQSARCALGDGGGGGLCGAVSRYWRNSRRTGCIGFHRDQAFGHAGRGIGRTRLFVAQRRSRCAECCARAVARYIAAITDTLTRQQSPRNAAMGSGPVSRPHPNTGAMGGAI